MAMEQKEESRAPAVYLARLQAEINHLNPDQIPDDDKAQRASRKTKFSQAIARLHKKINSLDDRLEKEKHAEKLIQMLDIVLNQNKKIKQKQDALKIYQILATLPKISEYPRLYAFGVGIVVFMLVGSIGSAILVLAMELMLNETLGFSEILSLFGNAMAEWFTGLIALPGFDKIIPYGIAGLIGFKYARSNYNASQQANTHAALALECSNETRTLINDLIQQANAFIKPMRIQLAQDMYIQYDPLKEKFLPDPTLHTLHKSKPNNNDKKAQNKKTMAATLLLCCNQPVPQVTISDEKQDQAPQADATNQTFIGDKIFEEPYINSNLLPALLKMSIDHQPEGTTLYDAKNRRLNFFPGLQPNQTFVIQNVTFRDQTIKQITVSAKGMTQVALPDQAPQNDPNLPPSSSQQVTVPSNGVQQIVPPDQQVAQNNQPLPQPPPGYSVGENPNRLQLSPRSPLPPSNQQPTATPPTTTITSSPE